jgi:hypothetical protein
MTFQEGHYVLEILGRIGVDCTYESIKVALEIKSRLRWIYFKVKLLENDKFSIAETFHKRFKEIIFNYFPAADKIYLKVIYHSRCTSDALLDPILNYLPLQISSPKICVFPSNFYFFLVVESDGRDVLDYFWKVWILENRVLELGFIIIIRLIVVAEAEGKDLI